MKNESSTMNIENLQTHGAPNNAQIFHDGSFAALILDRIDAEKVTPRSKWYFIFKNDVFWGLGALCVAIGSLSIAVLLYALTSAEFSYYNATHDSLLDFLYDILPLVWILCLLVFITVGYVQIRWTSRGYRYPIFVIVGGSLALSVVGGTVLHYYGLGEMIERAVGARIPFHEPVYIEQQAMWLNPQRGVIAGDVLEIAGNGQSFSIQDFNGQVWMIHADDLDAMDMNLVRMGHTIRIVGYTHDDMTGNSDGNPAVATEYSTSTKTMFGCLVLPWSTDSYGSDEPQSADMVTQTIATATISFSNFNQNNKNERNSVVERNSECKASKPYQLLQRLRAETQ